jgi:hypothetical protein
MGRDDQASQSIGLGKGDLHEEKTGSDWMGALASDIRDGTETECVCAVSDAEVEICFHVSGCRKCPGSVEEAHSIVRHSDRRMDVSVRQIIVARLLFIAHDCRKACRTPRQPVRKQL